MSLSAYQVMPTGGKYLFSRRVEIPAGFDPCDSRFSGATGTLQIHTYAVSLGHRTLNSVSYYEVYGGSWIWFEGDYLFVFSARLATSLVNKIVFMSTVWRVINVYFVIKHLIGL